LIFPSALPLFAAFGEDAFEKVAGGFDIRMRLAPVFGEFAFDGGFEDRSLVAFEVDLDAFEGGDTFVEAGELLFDLRDDDVLFS
jgi:hypothetical protein